MTDLRAAAQQALGQVQEFKRRWWLVPAFGNKVNKATREAITSAHSPIFELEHALRAALAQKAEPVQEPWSTRERFYAAVDRAVEAVRQEMKIKTVTMRLPEYDITLPIIDAYSGHVAVGAVVPAPPQRKVKGEEK